MQDHKTIFENLAGPGKAVDDEAREKRLKDAKEERDRVEDFNDGKKALINSADSDQDVTITTTGKRIQGNRSRYNKYHNYHEPLPLVFDVAEIALALGAGIRALESITDALSPAGAFGVAATKNAVPPPIYEDETYIYDTEKVSHETCQALNSEIARIRAIEQELKTVEDADMQAVIKAEMDELAATYEMRRHPATGEYVHSLDRVLAENARMNLDNGALKEMVAVYYLRGSAHDSRKRSVVLGDQYDQQTVEVIATDSDKVVVPARPIAPAM